MGAISCLGNHRRTVSCGRLAVAIAVAIAVSVGLPFCGCRSAHAQAGARIGVGVGTLDFVDAAKGLRAWSPVFGDTPVGLDKSGWPMEDAQTVFFDGRPPCQWLGDDQIDDPEARHRDVGGVYKLSFTGHAVLNIAENQAGLHSVANQKWDKKTNTTTADIVVDNSWPVLVVNFLRTNGGVRNVHLIRPGYASRPNQLFTDDFVGLATRFGLLRFMGASDTNTFQGEFWNPDSTIEWADRKLTTDATQGPWGRKNGAVAWEYAIDLANQAHTDMWLNVPANASHAYVKELAKLVKARLDPALNVYLEYSNEVWNWGFRQSLWNQAEAESEVASGRSVLNADGSTDKYQWGRRRYIRELHDIATIFAGVFGKDSLKHRIRPVHAWQFAGDWAFKEQFDWANRALEPLSDWLYATSVAPYFNLDALRKPADHLATATVGDMLAALRASSDASVAGRRQMATLASRYGLQLMTYEGGSDTSVQDAADNTVNVGNRVMAERAQGMRDIVLHDVADNWFALGGDTFVFLELADYYCRYGGWGLVEDPAHPDTPKMSAVMALLAGTK